MTPDRTIWLCIDCQHRHGIRDALIVAAPEPKWCQLCGAKGGLAPVRSSWLKPRHTLSPNRPNG